MDGLAKPRIQPAVTPSMDPVVKSDPATLVGNKADINMYLSYGLDHDVPFLGDYFGIGPVLEYNDAEYKPEIDALDDYLVKEIKAKRLDNTTDAVKSRLKQLERMAGLKDFIPTPQRVKTLAAYAKYLSELDAINQPVVL